MPPDLNRVFSLDHQESELTITTFEPLARKGHPVLVQSSPVMMENAPLIPLVMPHLLVSPFFIKLKDLQERFLGEVSFDDDEILIERNNKLALLCKELETLFGGSQQRLLEDLFLRSHHIHTKTDLQNFFALNLEKLETLLEQEKYVKTSKETNRGLQIKHKSVASKHLHKDPIENFRLQLREEGLDEELIEYLLQFLNQDDLMASAYYLVKQLVILEGEGLHWKNFSMHVNIEVKDSNTVILTYEKAEAYFYDDEFSKVQRKSAQDAPGDIKALARIQCRISLPAKSKSDPHLEPRTKFSRIKSELLEAYLEIYDPEVKQTYLTAKKNAIVQKIRQRQDLTSNDKLAIELYLRKYKTENGALDDDKLDTIDPSSLFLLIWNNVYDAEYLLNQLDATSFFTRVALSASWRQL